MSYARLWSAASIGAAEIRPRAWADRLSLISHLPCQAAHAGLLGRFLLKVARCFMGEYGVDEDLLVTEAGELLLQLLPHGR